MRITSWDLLMGFAFFLMGMLLTMLYEFIWWKHLIIGLIMVYVWFLGTIQEKYTKKKSKGGIKK